MSGRSATSVYYFLGGLTNFCEDMIYIVAALYYVQVAHFNPLQLVLAGTALEVTIFLFEVPTGVVADMYSRRLSVIIGVTLSGLCFAVQGLLPVFGFIILAEALHGLALTFISGALSAWITDEVGEEKIGEIFLKSGQIGTVCGLFGLIAGAGLALIQLSLPIIVGGTLMTLLGLSLIFIMPEHGFKPTPREERNSWQHMAYTFREGFRVAKARPLAFTILAVGLIYGAYSEGYDRLWEAHFLQDFSVPAFSLVIWFGIMRIGGMVVSFASLAVARRKLNLEKPGVIIRALLWLDILQAASILVFALTGNFFMAIATRWTATLARSTNGPIYDTWLNRNLESKVRATVLSLNSQVNALGQFACGPLLGLIGTLVSIPAALVASALILFLVVPFYAKAK